MIRPSTLALAVLLIAGSAAASDVVDPAIQAGADPRTPLDLPADLQGAFMEHMRHHMDSFDNVMVELGRGDFKEAAHIARAELVPGSGMGFGRYLPVEFRDLGLGMHRAAEAFADVADAVPAEPTAADWQKTIDALQGISTHCRACHAAYRLK